MKRVGDQAAGLAALGLRNIFSLLGCLKMNLQDPHQEAGPCLRARLGGTTPAPPARTGRGQGDDLGDRRVMIKGWWPPPLTADGTRRDAPDPRRVAVSAVLVLSSSQ
jgi:hypothetical protein